MIWSIIPEEMLFAQQNAQTERIELQYLGKKIYARGGKLDTLLSTDPADFLDQRFVPGVCINSGENPQ